MVILATVCLAMVTLETLKPPTTMTPPENGSPSTSHVQSSRNRILMKLSHKTTPDQRYSKSAKERLWGLRNKCACSVQCTKSFFFGILPFIRIMKDYNIKTDLVSDILAGLTVGIMQIPQGIFINIYLQSFCQSQKYCLLID